MRALNDLVISADPGYGDYHVQLTGITDDRVMGSLYSGEAEGDLLKAFRGVRNHKGFFVAIQMKNEAVMRELADRLGRDVSGTTYSIRFTLPEEFWVSRRPRGPRPAPPIVEYDGEHYRLESGDWVAEFDVGRPPLNPGFARGTVRKIHEDPTFSRNFDVSIRRYGIHVHTREGSRFFKFPHIKHPLSEQGRRLHQRPPVVNNDGDPYCADCPKQWTCRGGCIRKKAVPPLAKIRLVKPPGRSRP